MVAPDRRACRQEARRPERSQKGAPAYFLAHFSRISRASDAAARQSGRPGAAYSEVTCARNSFMALSWASLLSFGAVSRVFARIWAALVVAAWARSIHRPTSFQSLSKNTTTGMDW